MDRSQTFSTTRVLGHDADLLTLVVEKVWFPIHEDSSVSRSVADQFQYPSRFRAVDVGTENDLDLLYLAPLAAPSIPSRRAIRASRVGLRKPITQNYD